MDVPFVLIMAVLVHQPAIRRVAVVEEAALAADVVVEEIVVDEVEVVVVEASVTVVVEADLAAVVEGQPIVGVSETSKARR